MGIKIKEVIMTGSVKRCEGGHPIRFTKSNGRVENEPDIRYGFVYAHNLDSVACWVRNWSGGFVSCCFDYGQNRMINGFTAAFENGRVLKARCVEAFTVERGLLWVESFKIVNG